VATRIGRTASATFRKPRTSSGLTGSSIHHGSMEASPLSHLIGVDHHAAVGAQFGARDAAALEIMLRITPHFELERLPTLRYRLSTQRAHRLVAIAEPSCRCRVGRHALGQHRPLSLGTAVLPLAQERDRFIGRQRVQDVPKVDEPHHLFRTHFRHHAPNRFLYGLTP
jgi:hypothetical protein